MQTFWRFLFGHKTAVLLTATSGLSVIWVLGLLGPDDIQSHQIAIGGSGPLQLGVEFSPVDKQLNLYVDWTQDLFGDPWRSSENVSSQPPQIHLGASAGLVEILRTSAQPPGSGGKDIGEWIALARESDPRYPVAVEFPADLRGKLLGSTRIKHQLGATDFTRRSVTIAITAQGALSQVGNLPVVFMVPPGYSLDTAETFPAPYSVFPVTQGWTQYLASLSLREGRKGEGYPAHAIGSIRLTVLNKDRDKIREYILFFSSAIFGFGFGAILTGVSSHKS